MMQFDTSTRIRDAAVKVASGFLARAEPLTDGVVKVASEQGLNATQARRVCERANHMVHQALVKQANLVEFDLADPTLVETRMGATEKLATRYFVPAEPSTFTTKTASDDDEEEDEDKKTVKKREAEHEAGRKKEVEKEKEAALNEAAYLADQAYMESQEGFYAELRKLAADGDDLAETMEVLAEYAPLASQPRCLLEAAKITKAAALVGRGEPLEFTQRTMDILTDDGAREKVASELDPDLTNPGLQISGMPVKFIRGRHAIWTSVDTLLDSYMSALTAHDAVARAQLAPDHTRGRFVRNGVTHKAEREYRVAGRSV